MQGHVVDDRWELLVEAPGEPEVARWRATDRQTGAPAELLFLRPPEAHAAAAHASFAKAHRGLERVREPGVVRTLAVVGEGRAFVVREPLEDATLGDVRGPLPPPDVGAIGAALLPAIVAAGSATGGALFDRDVGLDARGAPVLAPRLRPSSRVGPKDTRWVAPEAFAGAAPDAAAGLYGLGVLLYRLATGDDPLRPSGPGGAPPRPSSVRPGIPDALDDAILRLLSVDPLRRASALPLLQEVAGPPPDLRLRASTSAATPRRGVDVGELVLDRREPAASRGRADVEAPGAAVVLPGAILAALEPARRSEAAGLAGLPLRFVEGLAAAGLPLVIESHRRAPEARRRAEELSARTGLPLVVRTAAGCLQPLAAVTWAGMAAALATTGALVGMAPLLLAALVAAVLSAWSAAAWVGAQRAWGAVDEARKRTLEDTRLRAAEPALQPLWERVAQLRRTLAELDLPETAALDVREALKDVERHLDDAARVAASARDTLSQVDLVQLRTRLRGLVERAGRDASAAVERDRLSRTIADLEAVKARADQVHDDASRIENALDELVAVLGQIGRRAEEGAAVERLARTTRLARETLAATDPGVGPPHRARERQ